MLELQGPFGTFELAGSLTDLETRSALINGLCGNHAKAILELDSDREVYFVSYDIETSDDLNEAHGKGIEAFLNCTTHVVVSTSDPNKFVDAYGVNSREAIEDFYDGTLIKGTFEQLVTNYITDDYTTDQDKYLKFASEALHFENQGIGYDYSDFTGLG